MPNLSASADAIREEIDDRTDVDNLLEEASDLSREAKKRERKVQKSTAELRDKRDELNEKIEEIESKNADYIERRRDAIKARKEAIRMWARSHTDETLDGVDGRTYESPFGEVSFTKVPFNFSWNDKDKVIESLKRLGHDDMLRRELKVPYKSTLKNKPQLVEQLDGVNPRPEHDEVSVELT